MWEQARSNQKRAAVLVIIMAAFLFLVGFLLGELLLPGAGLVGLGLAFIIWLVLTLVAFYSGDQVFLAISRARKIAPQDHPILYNVVEEMKIASGLPKMPNVYIIDDDAPNAFATGRRPETASVAVTTGLLRTLTRDELQGVVAHEMGHIKNRDVLYMMIVGVMMGAIVILAEIGLHSLWWGGGRRRTSSSEGGGQLQIIIMIVAVVLMILAPIIAQFIYFAISRRREYLADASSALFTRYPEGLASALEKISGTSKKLRSATRATAPMYIINPLAATARGLKNVTSTHPPISERVKILRSMGGGAGFANYDQAFKKTTGRPVGVVPPGSLAAAQQVEAAKPSPQEAEPDAPLGRLRNATDAIWRLNKYLFLTCPCGTKLKIPPAYAGKSIKCPSCRKPHPVPPR